MYNEMYVQNQGLYVQNQAFILPDVFKDRHQWWGRGFRCSLSLNMDRLFPKAIIYVLYH